MDYKQWVLVALVCYARRSIRSKSWQVVWAGNQIRPSGVGFVASATLMPCSFK